ncbi:MAG: ribosomal L7Ae/L30e/S12e/Gadd45 family protein [Halanaerobiales bacterium]
MLAQLKESQRVVGFKETLRAIESGEASRVFLAQDVDYTLQKKIKNVVSINKNIELVYVASKYKLGRACGIDVAAATVAILK